MGLSVVRADQPARIVPEIVRVSLWAVLGMWLARRLGRLLLLIVRSPTAMVTITVAGLGHPRLAVGASGIAAGRGRRPGRRAWWCGGSGGQTPSTRHVRAGSAVGPRRLGLPDAVDGGDGHGRPDRWRGMAPTMCRRCCAVRSNRSVDQGHGADAAPGKRSRTTPQSPTGSRKPSGPADCRVRSIPGRRHLLQLWLLISDPLEDRRRALRARPGLPDGRHPGRVGRRTARCGGCRCSATTS